MLNSIVHDLFSVTTEKGPPHHDKSIRAPLTYPQQIPYRIVRTSHLQWLNCILKARAATRKTSFTSVH